MLQPVRRKISRTIVSVLGKKKGKKGDPRVFRLFLSFLFIGLCANLALPSQLLVPVRSALPLLPQAFPETITLQKTIVDLRPYGLPFTNDLPLRYGLDIQGGTQVTLRADVSDIELAERAAALESAQEILRRRVDLFGVTEPRIRISNSGEESFLIVELPGLEEPEAALELIGQTAQLEFREPSELTATATESAEAYFSSFIPTGLGGEQLQQATVQFLPTTGEPIVSLQFNEEGARLFGEITERTLNQPLAIYLDGFPVSLPTVNEPIYGGQAQISGGFDVTTAQTLVTQLNAGALPVPIEIVGQRTIGAQLGQDSLGASFRAGVIGLFLVALFMILLYRWSGVIAVIGLFAYGAITLALYKLIPVTLTLPGIAGLVLSVGMAVDANILTFERIKEELRAGKPWKTALQLGFGRAWTSIKDANLATLSICFILFNPLNWSFLNTSGPVRGFAVTLALGIFVSLFTGVFFSRLLMSLFLKQPQKRTL